MTKQRESAEIVKNRILDVASELFSKYGIKGVGIRRIAAEAGINHALVIRYFGTKDELVTEILRREISSLTSTYPLEPGQSKAGKLSHLRGVLLNTLANDKNAMKLIIRSGLDGLSPESYVSENSNRAANLIAEWIGSQQKDKELPDPKLVSLIIVGAMFSLVSIAPWLMTSVGFAPEDFATHKEGIIDTLIWIIAQATGVQPAED